MQLTYPGAAMRGRPTRRRVIAGICSALAMVLPLRVRASTPWREEVERLTGGRTPATGGIEIEVLDYPPHRVSVLLSIAIESPMTAAQHVEAAHVLATRNAPPLLASFRFS